MKHCVLEACVSLPMPRDEALRLVQVTDTHLFDDLAGSLLGVCTETGFLSVLDRVREDMPQTHAVLMTGDLVHHGGAAYRRLAEHLDGLRKPVFLTPGNHDDLDAFVQHAGAAHVHACVRQVLTPHWQIVLLDSVLAGSPGGHLSAAELTALDDALTAHPDRHALIALHHPLVAIGSRWLDTMVVDNAAEALAVIGRHAQVRAVLCGHVHQSVDRVVDGVRMLATPSTCAQFLPGSEEFALDHAAVPGFRRLTLHADGAIGTQVERIEPAALRTCAAAG